MGCLEWEVLPVKPFDDGVCLEAFFLEVAESLGHLPPKVSGVKNDAATTYLEDHPSKYTPVN